MALNRKSKLVALSIFALVLALVLAGCNSSSGKPSSSPNGAVQDTNPDMVFKLDELFGMKPEGVLSFLDAVDYAFVDVDEMSSAIAADPSQLSAVQIVQLEQYGNSWLPSSFYDVAKYASASDVSESDYVQAMQDLRESFIDGYLVGISLNDVEGSLLDSDDYEADPLAGVRHRLGREKLAEGSDISSIMLYVQPGDGVIGYSGETPPSEAMAAARCAELQAASGLSEPAYQGVWQSGNGEAASFSAYHLGFCNSGDSDCFYWISWWAPPAGTGEEHGQMYICTLEEAYARFGATSNDDLISKWLEMNLDEKYKQVS